LASKALAPSAVRVKPMIHSRRTAEETKAKEPKSPVQRLSRSSDEEQGDLLIQSFWARGTDVIVNVRVADTDAKTYWSHDPHKVLASQEREKKKKYLQSCLEQRKHFTPFVVSTDGLIGREAGELLKRLSLRLADTWEQPHSVVRGFVSARMSIAIVRATHLCLRDRESPSPRSAAVLNGMIGLVSVCSKQTNKLSVLENYQFSNRNAILEFPYKLPSPILLFLEQ
jgi:hypothetical protein